MCNGSLLYCGVKPVPPQVWIFMSFCKHCFISCTQIKGKKPISKQCDVYSYGIVVWELLTHKIPFEDVTDVLDLCKNVAAVSIW